MAHPLEHAKNSARKFGGVAEDYLPIHKWLDESKAMLADFRHRALRHHAEGIFLAEQIFGVTIRNSKGRDVPVRYIGEQHVREDLGRIPSFQDCAESLPHRTGTQIQALVWRLSASSDRPSHAIAAIPNTGRKPCAKESTSPRKPNNLKRESR